MTLDTFALNIGTFFRSNSNSFTVTGVANTEDQYSNLVYSTNTDTGRHQQHRSCSYTFLFLCILHTIFT